MESPFEIFVDRLRGGRVEKIGGSFPPSFLEIEEAELQFRAPVEVKGEAYIAEDELVLHLKAKTSAKMPCSICNEMIETPLSVDNFYHAEPLANIKGAIFDFKDKLREALLIELPRYTECRKGNCPERGSITSYLRPKARSDDSLHYPFSNLEP